jgi:hypothetical protein
MQKQLPVSPWDISMAVQKPTFFQGEYLIFPLFLQLVLLSLAPSTKP